MPTSNTRIDSTMTTGCLQQHSLAADAAARLLEQAKKAAHKVVFKSDNTDPDDLASAYLIMVLKSRRDPRAHNIYKKMRWLYVDRYRKQKNDPLFGAAQLYEEATTLPESHENADARLKREQAAHLQTAMQNLTVQHREIIRLRFYESKKYREIAETLNMPLGSVRSRLHNAIKSLRSKLIALQHDATPPAV